MDPVSISIRELQQNLKRVLGRVERGEIVEVTRRRKPVARLAPVTGPATIQPWPDLAARMKSVFGDRVLDTAGSDAVSEGRGTR